MKPSRFSKIFVLCLLPVCALVLNSCVAPILAAGAAGAGAVAYLRGSLSSHVEGSLDECIRATRSGLSQMGCFKVREESDPDGAKFSYRDSTDTKITVFLERKPANFIRMTIRVGRMGDETRSLKILNAIQEEL
jgi:hypothetical protein